MFSFSFRPGLLSLQPAWIPSFLDLQTPKFIRKLVYVIIVADMIHKTNFKLCTIGMFRISAGKSHPKLKSCKLKRVSQETFESNSESFMCETSACRFYFGI